MVKLVCTEGRLDITLRSIGADSLEVGLLKVEEICKTVENDLRITFYKDWHKFRELLAFGRAIVRGYENNLCKDNVILTVFSDSANEDMQNDHHASSMNAGILAVRRQSKMYDEILSRALQDIPSSCEGVTQTKDKRLFLGGLIDYITNLQHTSEDKTSQEVFSGIEDCMQMLREIKDDDVIYVTDEDGECMSISQCLQSLPHSCEYNFPNLWKLYRTREFEKCKLGVVHYLATVMSDDSDIMSFMYKNFSDDTISEFQDGENGVYPHINAIFTKVLAMQNFHY